MSDKNFNLFFEAKASKDEDRVIEYIATKEVVDDMGRVFKVSGMDLSQFKKLKSVYFNHNTYDLPIGKGVAIRKKGDEVRIKVKYATPEEYSFADTVYKLVRGKYINGGSVGLRANPKDIEYPENKKIGGKLVRMIVNKSVLREFSITPDPANIEAVPLNAMMDKAIEDGIVDKIEMEEFKSVCNKMNEQNNSQEQNDTNDTDERIIELEAKIVELELQLNEQKMDEEIEGSIYEELYNEFNVSNEEDNQDDKDSLLNGFFE